MVLINLVLIWLWLLKFSKTKDKNGSPYSDWANVNRGVLLGTILGPLIFNIFYNYTFLFIEKFDINYSFLFIEKFDIYNFAADSTLFSCGNNLSVVLKSLEYDMKTILWWFNLNSLKVSSRKFQYTILGKSLRWKYNVEILGITIDKHLRFKKNTLRIYAGMRITNCMPLGE